LEPGGHCRTWKLTEPSSTETGGELTKGSIHEEAEVKNLVGKPSRMMEHPPAFVPRGQEQKRS